jgi:hypothetical protein
MRDETGRDVVECAEEYHFVDVGIDILGWEVAVLLQQLACVGSYMPINTGVVPAIFFRISV